MPIGGGAKVRVEDESSPSKRRSPTEVAANKDRPLLRSVRYAPIFVRRALQASFSAWIVLVMLAPLPLLAIFPNEERLFLAAAHGLSSDEQRGLKSLIDKRLPPLTSVSSLSLLIGVSPQLIGAIVRNTSRYYRTFDIPSGRRTRQIRTPKVALKIIQRWFGYHLNRAVTFSRHVHGFVPSRSTVTAAREHCPARWVLSLDLRDFFGSITAEHVFISLVRLGYERHAAHLMADLCTVPSAKKGRVLPQGAPSSPVLANLAFADTDVELERFAEDRCLRITRYADDISVSGVGEADPKLPAELRQVIEKSGWTIAEEKTRLVALPQRHPRVLGLLVDQSVPRLPKRYRNRLRMARHILANHQLTAEEKAKFAGHVAYAESVG